MGKIRVKTIGIEEEEQKQAEEAKKRALAKKASQAEETPVEAKPTSDETPKEESKKTKQVQTKGRIRSEKYQANSSKIDRTKPYKLTEALELLPSLTLSSFDETVELHINTISTGISGSLNLPHGTGKQVRVAIATEELIAEIESGAINFDVLIAEPMMMQKLAKVAKVLGPRGLMPNPKNGTVTPTPAEAAKKFEGGQTNFKTEAKFPIMHLSVGKVSFGTDKLKANITNAIQTVQKGNIKDVTLKSTMSPGITLDTATL